MDAIRSLWGRFRAWPLWAQGAVAVAVVIVIAGALATSGGETDEPSRADAVAQTADGATAGPAAAPLAAAAEDEQTPNGSEANESGAQPDTTDEPAPSTVGPLTEAEAVAAVLGCLRTLEPTDATTVAIEQLERRSSAIRLTDLEEDRSGWLIQGGSVDEIGAAAWRVLEDTAEIVAALPSAREIAPGSDGLLCRIDE